MRISVIALACFASLAMGQQYCGIGARLSGCDPSTSTCNCETNYDHIGWRPPCSYTDDACGCTGGQRGTCISVYIASFFSATGDYQQLTTCSLYRLIHHHH